MVENIQERFVVAVVVVVLGGFCSFVCVLFFCGFFVCLFVFVLFCFFGGRGGGCDLSQVFQHIVAYTVWSGAFLGLRFLMAEHSSEIFWVLFMHRLGMFSCFTPCLSFSLKSSTLYVVMGRVLSLLQRWANSFAAFSSTSISLGT